MYFFVCEWRGDMRAGTSWFSRGRPVLSQDVHLSLLPPLQGLLLTLGGWGAWSEQPGRKAAQGLHWCSSVWSVLPSPTPGSSPHLLWCTVLPQEQWVPKSGLSPLVAEPYGIFVRRLLPKSPESEYPGLSPRIPTYWWTLYASFIHSKSWHSLILKIWFCPWSHAAAAAKSFQSCLTLRNPWTTAYQALPSMGVSRQECSSGLSLPSLPWS